VGSELLPSITLLAQGGNTRDFLISMATLWVPLILIFYFLLIRPQRRQEAERRAKLAALKKNDRVITVGGIYGVVTNVQREIDEVTIKVDETSNTKLRVTLGSIARVLGDESSDGSSSK
jgi:preprotein translocase subunit YajC